MGPRILIVGHEPENREVLVYVLVGEGYLVTTFDSSDEAIEFAAKSALPVVLFFGSLRSFADVRARREAELGHVKVILATGAQNVPSFAGTDVLKKPFTIERLLAVLEKAA